VSNLVNRGKRALLLQCFKKRYTSEKKNINITISLTSLT